MPSRTSSVSTNDPSWNGLRTCGPNHFNFAAWPCRRRGDRVKRREFISLLAGLAACRPKVAHAQHAGMPVVGVVGSGSPAVYTERLTLIRRGLEETGFTESRTVAIEYRWAEGQLDRLPSLADELVARGVNVVVATGGLQAVHAAMTATNTI